MSEKERTPEPLQKVAAMLSDLGVEILASLLHRHATLAELAMALELPPDKVRDQLDQLVAAGIVEMSEGKVRGGAVENTYHVNDQMLLIGDDELVGIPSALREQLVAAAAQLAWSDAMAALKAGSMVAREGSVVAYVPLPVDEQGWSEISEAYQHAVYRTLQVQRESRARLEKTGAEPLFASSSVFLFELPADA